MNLNQIEVFCKIVDAGSISKAAKLLHLTQPALSIQLRELENSFQTKLVERTNRGIKPTKAGKLVYNYGQRILSLNKNLFLEVSKLNMSNSNLVIGAEITYSYFLPYLITEFKAIQNHIDVMLVYDNSQGVIRNVIDGSVDIGLIVGNSLPFIPCNQKDFHTHLLGEDELKLIVPVDENWSDIDEIDLTDLLHIPLIIREKGSGVREIIEEVLESRGLGTNDLNLALEVNNTSAIKAFIEAGRGCSLIPIVYAQKEINQGILKAVTVKDAAFKLFYNGVYDYRKIQAPVSETFFNFIKKKEFPPSCQQSVFAVSK